MMNKNDGLVSKKFEIIVQEGEIFGEVSEEDIVHAEKRLNVSFPEEYRAFLLKYGALLGNGFEIYGLPQSSGEDEPALWQNVVTVTEALRACQQIGSENHHMIPISSDGMATYYFLKTNIPNTEIWLMNPNIQKPMASSLLELIQKLQQDA